MALAVIPAIFTLFTTALFIFFNRYFTGKSPARQSFGFFTQNVIPPYYSTLIVKMNSIINN